MESTRRIVIPGGSGYLGTQLSNYLAGRGYEIVILRGYEIVILSRKGATDAGPIRHVAWDGQTIGPWAGVFESSHAVVNLAGRTVNCRYNAKHRSEIYESRLRSTKVIGDAIAIARNPPKVWLNSSSATIYRHALDRPMDETTGEIGAGFSVDVCQKWEKELADAQTPNTRKVPLRTAIVFGPGKGGPFEAFAKVVKLGLGGTLGPGDQFVSWVHSLDFCRAVEFLIEHEEIQGPVNIASPNPIPNKEFMRIFRQAFHKKIGLPATRWMLEIGAFVLRTETELLLKSRRVIPGRLLNSGFEFKYPDFAKALTQIINDEQQA
jgi:uncharacterized protein (TIGR01777 family)